MKFGFIPTEGGRYFKEAITEVIYGEDVGFDSVWLEEHHSIHNHFWPSPLMALAGIATRTTHVLLGTDIAILPFYHPVRLAEDIAMLDMISGGRAILGAALGYRPPEFELYDIELDGRGARYVEMLKIIRSLWIQDQVEYNGRFFKIKGSIEPKPVNSIPIWLGGWGELSLKRAAQFGDAWIPGPSANLSKLLDAQKQYNAFLKDFNKDPNKLPKPLTRDVVIAETHDQAWELAEKFLLVNYRNQFGSDWNHPLIGSQHQTPVALDALSSDRFIIGNPDDCVQQIKHYVETFEVDHLICRLYFSEMPHKHIMKELKLFSQEVFPAFR